MSLESLMASLLGSGGVVSIFFWAIRRYIEKRLSEAEKKEEERIELKIRQRKADEEIMHAESRVLFWLHHAVTHDGQHNGELEEAWRAFQAAEQHKKDFDREILAKHSID